jgi:hypothetical protein
MRRWIVTLAALATVGVGVLGDPAAASTATAPCAPTDPLCQLLTPTTKRPPSSSSTARPTETTATTAGAGAEVLPAPVSGAAGEATAASVAVGGSKVPAVPVGAALELPPLTIPDFGAPTPAAAPAPVVRRPVRSGPGEPAPARPEAATSEDPARAVALAVGVPALLVGVSLLARRRVRPGAGPPPLAGL